MVPGVVARWKRIAYVSKRGDDPIARRRFTSFDRTACGAQENHDRWRRQRPGSVLGIGDELQSRRHASRFCARTRSTGLAMRRGGLRSWMSPAAKSACRRRSIAVSSSPSGAPMASRLALIEQSRTINLSRIDVSSGRVHDADAGAPGQRFRHRAQPHRRCEQRRCASGGDLCVERTLRAIGAPTIGSPA